MIIDDKAYVWSAAEQAQVYLVPGFQPHGELEVVPGPPGPHGQHYLREPDSTLLDVAMVVEHLATECPRLLKEIKCSAATVRMCNIAGLAEALACIPSFNLQALVPVQPFDCIVRRGAMNYSLRQQRMAEQVPSLRHAEAMAGHKVKGLQRDLNNAQAERQAERAKMAAELQKMT
jgi:hypothetical protein